MPLLLNSHVDIYIVCGTMKTLATFAWSLRTGSAVSFWLINVFKTFAKRVAAVDSGLLAAEVLEGPLVVLEESSPAALEETPAEVVRVVGVVASFCSSCGGCAPDARNACGAKCALQNEPW